MTEVHVYSATKQNATRYTVALLDHVFIVQNRRRCRIRCCRCKKLRWAAYLHVQVYYDGSYYSCKPGRGCRQ